MEFKDRDIEAFWNDPDANIPRRVPPNCRKRCTANYRSLMLLHLCSISRFLQTTIQRNSKEIAQSNTASALTSSGAYALNGLIKERKGLNSVTTTNTYISTPGEILLEEFLEPMGISQYRLAKAIHKPQSAISDIVHGRRAITTEMAWLLSQALGTTPQFWLNLETTYQLKTFDTTAMPQVVAL